MAPAVRVKQWKVEELTVRVYGNVDALAATAARDAAAVLRDAIEQHGRANVMLATGTSQLRFLDHLVGVGDDVGGDQGTRIDW
ncbi:MAG: Glucosamine-6-phosphate isomerase/6-phosphogluconolactonase, partial [Actinomycetota bacterium]|nr:Glucosamine-6-phosphate isomerase/6-phosphogluconolactonase [Actinomycetota bacterium]